MVERLHSRQKSNRLSWAHFHEKSRPGECVEYIYIYIYIYIWLETVKYVEFANDASKHAYQPNPAPGSSASFNQSLLIGLSWRAVNLCQYCHYWSKYFQYLVATELSDFHEMVATTVKTTFRKLKPKIICYRKYKHFSNNTFRETLLEELSQVWISNNDDEYNNF